jgi:hypothetical protein
VVIIYFFAVYKLRQYSSSLSPSVLLLHLTKIPIFEIREDAMALYSEVGEETKEENKEEWVGEKREALTKVQVNLEGNHDKIKKRKIELDAAKKKDGSIIKTVCPEEKTKAKKRPRPNPKKEKDDPKKYIGQRLAKFFDNPTPKNPDKQIIYFGTLRTTTTTKRSLISMRFAMQSFFTRKTKNTMKNIFLDKIGKQEIDTSYL